LTRTNWTLCHYVHITGNFRHAHTPTSSGVRTRNSVLAQLQCRPEHVFAATHHAVIGSKKTIKRQGQTNIWEVSRWQIFTVQLCARCSANNKRVNITKIDRYTWKRLDRNKSGFTSRERLVSWSVHHALPASPLCFPISRSFSWSGALILYALTHSKHF
jgi:hypothetical protein